jgi:hypothetical protein
MASARSRASAASPSAFDRNGRLGHRQARRGCERRKPGFLRGHGLGQILHQGAKLVDFRRQRPDRGLDAALEVAGVVLEGHDLAPQFADLAGEVGGSARKVGDLVADIAAVAHARRNGIVDGEGRERRQRHDRGLGRRRPSSR